MEKEKESIMKYSKVDPLPQPPADAPMSDLWPNLHRQAPAPDPYEAYTTATSTQKCLTCDDDSHLTNDGAEVVCTRCGTIVDIPLDQNAEYRWFSSDHGSGSSADPSRCSFPVNHLLPESSLGTVILNQRQSSLMRRIKRYHMWNLMPYRERTLWSVFESLTVRATNAGVSTAILEEAKELYAQLTASQICRGQAQRDAMLAACLWEALKRHDAQRLPKDVADIFQLPLRSVTKGIKQFQHILSVRSNDQKRDTYAGAAVAAATVEPATAEQRALQRMSIGRARAIKTTTYKDFVQPFLTNLSIPRARQAELETLVFDVCARTEELNVVPENTPPSLTASVIAFCLGELGMSVDHVEIARVCGISAVTIHKCLKRMSAVRAELLGSQ
jgi:transcription initiation factor TFIIIB Brf1 subunit/transcription initiation factor TFIIB